MRYLRNLINNQASSELRDCIDELSDEALCAAPWIFDLWAHPHQIPPRENYKTWVIIGGRGAGKTRAGAEWVRGLVEGAEPFDKGQYNRIALIGQSLHEAREVMIFGPSGIMASSPPDRRPNWNSTRNRLIWPNGAEAFVFSAHKPESLRGPQFDAAWLDEFAKWPNADEVWKMLQFCLRLNEKSRSLITTTPRRKAILKEIIEAADTVASHATSRDNTIGLPESYLNNIQAQYGGTWLGRQEIEGQMIDDHENALWKNEMFRYCAEPPTHFDRIVVAIDPSVSSGKMSDETGIIVVGALYPDNDPRTWKCYVIEDGSQHCKTPEEWAAHAISLYERHEADVIVAELNQGGEMVEAMLRNINPFVNFMPKYARDAKSKRAESIAALYRQGRVFHFRGLSELESQMCLMEAEGYQGKGSPDRLDACVWALQVLMLDALKIQRPHQLRQL